MTKQPKNEVLEQARNPPWARLDLKQADTVWLAVCGGAARVAAGRLRCATNDAVAFAAVEGNRQGILDGSIGGRGHTNRCAAEGLETDHNFMKEPEAIEQKQLNKNGGYSVKVIAGLKGRRRNNVVGSMITTDVRGILRNMRPMHS